MNPKIKPFIELNKIRHLPGYQRKRAEWRLLLIAEYFSECEALENKESPIHLHQRKLFLKYCDAKGLNPATFLNWLTNYQSRGIMGLVPAYGNRKGASPYAKSILPILAEIIKPDQSFADLHRSLVPICEQRGIKAPSAKTIQRLVEACGLTARQKNYRTISTIKVHLDVDPQRPLKCLNQLTDFIDNSNVIAPKAKERSLKQMRSILGTMDARPEMSLPRALAPDEVLLLKKYKASMHKRYSAKATALLMLNKTTTMAELVRATGRQPSTIYRWLRLFAKQGINFIEVKLRHPERERHIEQRRVRIIDILHTPPAAYNINRTSWNYASIAEVYAALYSVHISVKTVERAVKASGCTWRRARRVQTSPDPLYREKITKVFETLRALKEDEAFFFIDEAGPYQVKKYGGVALCPPGTVRTLPERQRSKGKVLLVAALEALSNQVTWRFIENKGSQSTIDIIEDIRLKYSKRSKLYVTWDSLVTHRSLTIDDWIKRINREAGHGIGPQIEVVPLPSHAQFLNVIESVFSGMKRAIIANSDYGSKKEMEGAISRHYEERNLYFQETPKRAGHKIWDREAFDLEKLAGGLFKRM